MIPIIRSDPFVVKAQCSTPDEDGKQMVLIYDKENTIIYQEPVSKRMAKKVGSVSYWWAVLNKRGIIELQTESNEEEFDQFDYITMNAKDNDSYEQI